MTDAEPRADGPRRGGGARAVLLAYELRMLLRDTRTILIAVVAPLVLFPLFIWVTRVVDEREEQRAEETTYTYVVTGDRAEWARERVEAALALPPADTSAAPLRFEEVPAGDDFPTDAAAVDSLLEDRDIRTVVRGLSAEAAAALDRAAASGSAGDAPAGDGRAAGLPLVRLEYRASSDFGRRAAGALQDRLERLRELRRDSLFLARGFPVDPDAVAPVEAVNTASAEREGGAILGLALTPFLLLIMLTGGSIVAADAISGEKERGTLETLLTTAVRRAEIVQAKLLAVVVVGLAVAVVNILNLLVYVVLGVFELPERFAVELSIPDLALLLALLLPLTVLVAAALLLLSGYSKSYKEYQIYFFPLFLFLLVPSVAGALPGMELRSAVAFVPISGIGVAVREVMMGERDWLFLAVAWLSTSGVAWGLVRLTERTLSTERLVTGAELDEAELEGGPAVFPRRVLRWFAVMWAVFFVASAWLGDDLGLRGQIVVNLVGIFFGGSLLMIRRYRLPVREALALRPVPPAVWLAVLIGAPSALLVASGLANLVNAWVFPVPQRLIEAFAESLALDVPLWQLVLFVVIMPGVLEEIAFRGVLLHGLRRYLRPVALCLAVGAIFGLFHVSLFRIVPTAYLGVILAAVVLVTGSIYPAMLWHALNNAAALLPVQLGWIDADFAPPAWWYAVAVAGMGVSAAILWVNRRPYPGVRGMRRGGREVGGGAGGP